MAEDQLNVDNPNHKSALGGDFAFRLFCCDISNQQELNEFISTQKDLVKETDAQISKIKHVE